MFSSGGAATSAPHTSPHIPQLTQNPLPDAKETLAQTGLVKRQGEGESTGNRGGGSNGIGQEEGGGGGGGEGEGKGNGPAPSA